jgi:hypothetical protein
MPHINKQVTNSDGCLTPRQTVKVTIIANFGFDLNRRSCNCEKTIIEGRDCSETQMRRMSAIGRRYQATAMESDKTLFVL